MRTLAKAPTKSGPGRQGGVRPGLTLSRGQKVGLYGGSFNPVHDGHLHVARTALKRLGLDRVVWLVSPGNPLKRATPPAAIKLRLAEMADRVREPKMIVSDVESRIGAQYTIDTVRWLKRRFPGVRFVWVMGADSLAGFHRWRGWSDLAHEIPIAVISRPGIALRSRFSPLARRFARFRRSEGSARTLAVAEGSSWIYLTAPFHAISSTALRESRLNKPAFRAMENVEQHRSRSIP